MRSFLSYMSSSIKVRMTEMKIMYNIPGGYMYGGDFVLQKNLFPPDVVEKIKTFPLQEGDVMVATSTRAGTTWMTEIMYLMCNDVSIEKATQAPLHIRCRYLEMCFPGEEPSLEAAFKDPHPMVVKTHLPPRFFEMQLKDRKTKVIVVYRNIKDQLVSFYKFYQNTGMMGNFKGTWEEFFEMFKSKHLLYGDMMDWNLSWWAKRDNDNILFVSFEEMKQDIESVIHKLAAHIGKSLSSDDIAKIVQHTRFENMKDNPMVNLFKAPGAKFEGKDFIRSGEIGISSKYFTPEQAVFVEKRFKEEYEPVGFKY